jgi:hypothetical protein
MLQSLRERVLAANLELVRRNLVLYTFGNAIGISREEGLVGSAIFAFLAAGTFKTIKEAQDKICPGHKVARRNVLMKTYILCITGCISVWARPSATGLGAMLPTLIAVAETAARQATG